MTDTHDGSWVPVNTNQWEEITFDLTDKIGQTINRMVLIPDNSSVRNAERICYWDNISFNSNNPSGMNEINTSTIQLYPNPFSNELSIKSETEINRIEIRNLLGQAIKTVYVKNNSTSIDLSHVAPGNYFVTVKLSNGNTSTKKAVKL